MLSLFAIRNPQAGKRALQKVTDFIWFLQSCTCYHIKSKETKSFSTIEGVPTYNTASLTIVFIHGCQSTEQYSISCIIKALHFNPNAVLLIPFVSQQSALTLDTASLASIKAFMHACTLRKLII